MSRKFRNVIFLVFLATFFGFSRKKDAITYSFPSQSPFVYDIAFSSTGQVLFFADNKTIKAFLFEDQQLLGEFVNGHTEAITALAVSSDSLIIASGDKDSRIVLWDINNRKVIKDIYEHSEAILSLAISPCNKFLASGSADNSMVLYDLINHSVIENYKMFKGNVTSVKFSHDGNWLGAVGGDGQFLLVNMVTKSVSDIKQVNTFLRDLDFNKTNNELVTTGNNGRISYWSITEKGLIAQKLETRVGFSWLMSVQLTLDGKSFMVADSRGRVRVQTPFGKIDKNLKVPVFKAILRPGPYPHIFVVAATRGKGVEVFTGLEMNHRL